MTNKTPQTQTAGSPPVSTLADAAPFGLRQEYETWQALFEAQPALLQRFLETQAQLLAGALAQPDHPPHIRFAFPDQVVVQPGEKAQPVPPEFRQQMAGGLIERVTRFN